MQMSWPTFVVHFVFCGLENIAAFILKISVDYVGTCIVLGMAWSSLAHL